MCKWACRHIHKNAVNDVRWNANGNWLLTGSSDKLVKLFDLRAMKELRTFSTPGEVTCLAWHPVHETLFASGGMDGNTSFWLTECVVWMHACCFYALLGPNPSSIAAPRLRCGLCRRPNCRTSATRSRASGAWTGTRLATSWSPAPTTRRSAYGPRAVGIRLLAYPPPLPQFYSRARPGEDAGSVEPGELVEIGVHSVWF